MTLALTLLVTTLALNVSAYKILILYPTTSYSHQIPAMGLTEALVKKGHEVFVLSPNVVLGLEKSYTYVDFSWAYKLFLEHTTGKGVNLQQELSKWDLISFFEAYMEVTKKQYESDTFKQFYKRVKEEAIVFDVIIVECFFIPYGVGFARLFTGSNNKPVISMSTVSGDFYGQEAMGDILHLSYAPSIYGSYSGKMSLWERIDNWASHLYISRRVRKLAEESARAFFRETYGPKAESLVDDCWSNVSLSLKASNALYYYPRALPPNVVEVLQEWLDGAEKGVIYVSLGSNMKSKVLPKAVRSNLLKVFRELPAGYRVLWKWEQDGKIPGQSDNILPYKWMPQQDVLAHPKVKVFITQGGFQSFQETVHYGVPIVAIPWFGDQEMNVAKIVDAEIGVRILPRELFTFEKVKSAVEAVLFDERYTKNMKRLSELSHDFTSRARDEAVFWVEHVAKHGGASHFRPLTAETSYFQFFCLDILSVILGLGFIALYVIVQVFRFLVLNVYSSPHEKVKKS